ncbi:biopolymer transporter ExbD [Pedobacter frigiditerrae]|uniref:Biopolymer transporter ExbD n=1 Tax=Pedobacter frigiditerrae TaxID=2530452 RepID=A0A4R0N2J5_9SPHI|nr:biopolymer transporter ExbD [Pedobacter frigiditerrae]TCC94059.1 biopolymer transporter ExbD [Pedobacter frigiditerrae]
MATLNIPQNGKATKGRTAKALPGVDLTAMVDLAFLLITFFMLTTSLSKMKAIDIAKNVPAEILAPYPASRTMTILLGKENKVVYYMGEAKDAMMNVASLTTIKAQIIANKLMVQKIHQIEKEKSMIIIIKPTSTSVYKNFVDIIDEMNINGIESYAIDDKYILDQEKSYMKTKGI